VIDDIFVFDSVIHALDLSDDNTLPDATAQHGRSQILGMHNGRDIDPEAHSRLTWSPEDLYEMVFVRAPTDMAVAQVVPIFDFFRDGFAPVATQHAMAQKYPDRVVFCGGVDPKWHGLPDALDQIDYQITELGAAQMKFYNCHIRKSWRCDDEKLAYPMYEKIRDLGVDILNFHKGVPFGTQPVEPLSPLDLQNAARDFPDMNFVVYHLAQPPAYYFDELLSMASRFSNIYIALSGALNFFYVAPRTVHTWMGRLLMEVGVERLLWGSEAALAGGPGPGLRALMDMEIPEDLRSDYGYPQITRKDKELILGRNLARLTNTDIDAKRAELAKSA
jgi:hypothetical protein